MQTRRDFLKVAAMFSGTAGAAGFLPGSIQKAFAIEPAPGSTYLDAEHIVILMQENRSFDHAYGTLQGVRGFNDPRATRQANGNSVFLQTDPMGNTYAPWRLDIKDTKITWMGSIPHSRNSQVDAWNNGHHNNWVDAKRSSRKAYYDVPITMGHYTREDIPFYYALADAFTICDQNYCGVMTSTTPNRSLMWTGTIRSEQKANSSVYMRNPEFRHCKWKTFPERLQEQGVTWKIYQNEVNTTGNLEPESAPWLGNVGNITEHFDQFNVNMVHADTVHIQQELVVANTKLADLKKQTVDPTLRDDHQAAINEAEEHAKALQKALSDGGNALGKLSQHDQELHMRAFVTNAADEDFRKMETLTFKDGDKDVKLDVPKGDVLYQFRKDVEKGHLPMVSWLVAPGAFSDHPAHPWYGAWYLSEAMNILTHNPEVWKKTIFILLYDENDGYFDHGPSYVAADPRNKATGRASEGIDTALEYTYASDEKAQEVPDKDARSGPIGLGFRVPMVIASPWSRGGYVNSQLFDQTSTIQFVEHFVEAKLGKKVHEDNLSMFRREMLGDLTSVFRPFDPSMKEMAFLDRDKHVEAIRRAKYKQVPANYVKLTDDQVAAYNKDPHALENASHQEKGTRPACALPYELYCEADFNAEHKVVGLAMRAGNAVHGAKSAGSPFNVYLRNTAKAGSSISRGKNNDNMWVATYAVKAGDTLQQAFPVQLFAKGSYEMEVHAPNGFYRHFIGDDKPAPLSVRCMYQRGAGGLTGNVEARVKNLTSGPLKVTIADNSYKTGTQEKTIPAGQQIVAVLDLSKHHNWYDFTVTAEGHATSVRYAGRVESGKQTMTDPLMGGVIA